MSKAGFCEDGRDNQMPPFPCHWMCMTSRATHCDVPSGAVLETPRKMIPILHFLHLSCHPSQFAAPLPSKLAPTTGHSPQLQFSWENGARFLEEAVRETRSSEKRSNQWPQLHFREKPSGLMETLPGLGLRGPRATAASSTTRDSWEVSPFAPIASIYRFLSTVGHTA